MTGECRITQNRRRPMLRRTLMKLSFVTIVAAQLLAVAPGAVGAGEAASRPSGKVAAHVATRALPAPPLPQSLVGDSSFPGLPGGPVCTPAAVGATQFGFSLLPRGELGGGLAGFVSLAAINPVGCPGVIM
jgi:hypothetical protein